MNFFECLPRIITLQSYMYVMNASLYSCCLRFSKQEQTYTLRKEAKQWKIFGTSINVTFETEVAKIENEHCLRKTAI